jgi:hypothetical protein
MKNKFKRFGLEKHGLLIIVVEFMGAAGLITGFIFKPVLIISSLGLAILMLMGLIVRIRLKDNFWISLPALFYLALNTTIFFGAIH